MTTADRIRLRGELVPEFEARIRAAVWEGIEAADVRLLASDDGHYYGGDSAAPDSFGRKNELERMADAAARAAGKELRNWL